MAMYLVCRPMNLAQTLSEFQALTDDNIHAYNIDTRFFTRSLISEPYTAYHFEIPSTILETEIPRILWMAPDIT